MPVFDRGYRGYQGGALTPAWSRFGVITRYALANVFASRLFVVFFVFCLLFPLGCGVFIYLRYNVEALTALDLSLLDLFAIDASFFHFYLEQQSGLALILALAVGPALISPDQRNNAMPLYLSRPLSRLDYALGKWLVLAMLLSAVTWVPGLLLFALQSYLAGNSWLRDHLRVGFALFVGAWAWILLLSLVALAISAWVKWKPWARVIFLGAFFILLALGRLFTQLYDSWLGSLLSPFDLMQSVWAQLFAVDTFVRLPATAAWIALGLLYTLCCWLFFRRIRAYEVAV